VNDDVHLEIRPLGIVSSLACITRNASLPLSYSNTLIAW
jgi:hypothetical protein